MNLDMKVHPALAGLVIALAIIAVATKFWADDEALKYSGPSQLLIDPYGHLYIQIQNQLLEHSADGEFVRRHDLGALGVQSMIGAIAFFSNGDVLLRRGEDRRSLGDSVAAYQRLENTSDLVPESSGAGLARCNLQALQCTSFADPAIDFKSTIGLHVDWRNDDVYISDTSRHTIRKYSGNGIALAEPKRGFKFPNQITMQDGVLLVVDTNYHQIRMVEPRSDTFGKAIRSISVVPDDALYDNLQWPSHLARIGAEWWVNNMNNGMRDGGIFVFDDDWQYVRRVSLPENADPISILPFGAGALISDWSNDRIYQLALSGAVLEDFQSPGLEAILEESRKSRAFYGGLSWMGVVLLGLALVGLITKSISSPVPKKAPEECNVDEAIAIGNNELVWFEPDPKTVRKIRLHQKLAGVALLGIFVLLVSLFAADGNAAFATKLLPPAASLVLIYAILSWMSRANTGTAIGFQGNDLILRNHKGAQSRYPVKTAVYDKSAIATPDMAVILGQQPLPLYQPDLVTEQLLPRLAQAKAISALKMQRVLLRLRHPQAIAILLIVIAAIILSLVVR